jgi:Cys/Met metabolism PLP-dependent enzyme
VGQVEGGHAVAFSSGMAAIAAVLDLVPAGGRIVAPKDCYFGVGEFLADAQQQGRWAVDRVDLTDSASVQAAVAGADMLWLETPSNPLLDIADLPALCAAGHHAGAIVGADNTFATPLLQQPLALGAVVVVHSATKFIGGHSDLLSASPSAARRPSPGACATAVASRAQRPAPLRPSWRCAACAHLPCGSTAASSMRANSHVGSMNTLPSAACATPAFPATPDTAPPPHR